MSIREWKSALLLAMSLTVIPGVSFRMIASLGEVRVRAAAWVIASIVGLLAALAPARAHAQAPQSRIEGVVYDSLRTQPLAGATVQFIEAPPGHGAYAATTDSLGKFHIDGVRPGQYITGILDPLLDTLGVLAPYASITVADGANARVALAIPSAARLTTAICAPAQATRVAQAAADTTGALVGHVYDMVTGAPATSSLIAVVWPVLTLDVHGMHRETRQLHARTNEEGWFAICGLGAGDYQVRAESGARNTGFIDFVLQARDIARMSLVLGADSDSASAADTSAREGRASITGIVTAGGHPVEGAQVVVDGSTVSATTDARGAFTLAGIPDGTRMAEARALGFAPKRVPVEPSRGERRTMAIAMEKRVNTLDAVTVFGTKPARRFNDLNGFLQRQRSGFGKFLTRAQIDQADANSVCDLLRRVNGIHVDDTGISGCQATLRGGMSGLGRSGRACEPKVFLDGIPFGGNVAELARAVSPREIMGIEVYSTATEPPQFFGACGSLVVWTRS
jgi:hypothetical protein